MAGLRHKEPLLQERLALEDELARRGIEEFDGSAYFGQVRVDGEKRFLKANPVLDSWKTEVEALERLGSHPHIPNLYDSFSIAGRFPLGVIVTDYCEGTLLREAVLCERVYEGFFELGGVVEHCARNGIMHDDIDGGNVVFGKGAYLFDFDRAVLDVQDTGDYSFLLGAFLGLLAPTIAARMKYAGLEQMARKRLFLKCGSTFPNIPSRSVYEEYLRSVGDDVMAEIAAPGN